MVILQYLRPGDKPPTVIQKKCSNHHILFWCPQVGPKLPASRWAKRAKLPAPRVPLGSWPAICRSTGSWLSASSRAVQTNSDETTNYEVKTQLEPLFVVQKSGLGRPNIYGWFKTHSSSTVCDSKAGIKLLVWNTFFHLWDDVKKLDKYVSTVFKPPSRKVPVFFFFFFFCGRWLWCQVQMMPSGTRLNGLRKWEPVLELLPDFCPLVRSVECCNMLQLPCWRVWTLTVSHDFFNDFCRVSFWYPKKTKSRLLSVVTQALWSSTLRIRSSTPRGIGPCSETGVASGGSQETAGCWRVEQSRLFVEAFAQRGWAAGVVVPRYGLGSKFEKPGVEGMN